MLQLIVDEEQAKVLGQSGNQLEIRDRTGRLLGYASPVCTAEEIAEARRRLASDEPRYTTEQLLEYLQSLKHR